MRIAVLGRVDDGCCYYRIILPLDYIQWREDDIVKIFYPDKTDLSSKNRSLCGYISELDFFNPDIIFFNRSIPEKSIDWIKEQKKKGVKIIADIDDYWEINSLHPYYSYWYKNHINTHIRATIEVSDLVLTTTDRLRNIILLLNKNCIVIPNAVPFGDRYFNNTNKVSSEKMNFLYAGGSSHYQDVSILKNKFERIGSDQYIKGKAIFTLAGFNPLPNKHCEWDKMASIFKRTNSYQILDTLPIQEHMKLYDSANVVLVPLVRNEFNQYKSILKIVEASTRELPCIVSNVPPYSDLGNISGIFYDNWIENIKYSIKNPTFVIDKGKELSIEMKKRFDLKDWAKTRYDIFKNLV